LQADLSLDRAAPSHLEDQPWLVGHVPSVASSGPKARSTRAHPTALSAAHRCPQSVPKDYGSLGRQ
jgi:hypothetical protein